MLTVCVLGTENNTLKQLQLNARAIHDSLTASMSVTHDTLDHAVHANTYTAQCYARHTTG